MMRSGIAAIAILATSLAAASPSEGQATAPNPSIAVEAWGPLRPSATDLGMVLPLPNGSGHDERLPLPVTAGLLGRQGSERSSSAGYTIGGAFAGALLGVGVLYLTNWDNCTETGSMCGLSIPLYAGAGALGGGLLGYLVGRTRE